MSTGFAVTGHAICLLAAASLWLAASLALSVWRVGRGPRGLRFICVYLRMYWTSGPGVASGFDAAAGNMDLQYGSIWVSLYRRLYPWRSRLAVPPHSHHPLSASLPPLPSSIRPSTPSRHPLSSFHLSLACSVSFPILCANVVFPARAFARMLLLAIGLGAASSLSTSLLCVFALLFPGTLALALFIRRGIFLFNPRVTYTHTHKCKLENAHKRRTHLTCVVMTGSLNIES